MPDLVNMIMRRACELLASDDKKMFDNASFAEAFLEMVGSKLDGFAVSAILTGRDDCEFLSGDLYFKFLE